MRDQAPESFRSEKSARAYENILVTATELLTRKGFEAVTMRDIAQACGLSVGAFYYYFESKESVVLALYRQWSLEIQDLYQAGGNARASFPDAVREFLGLKLRHLTPHRDLLRMLLKEAIDPRSLLSPFSAKAAEAFKPTLETFRLIVERTGAARGNEVLALARSLWLAHLNLLIFWIHDCTAGFQATHRLIETLAALLKWSQVAARVPWLRRIRRDVLREVNSLFPVEPGNNG